MSDLSARLKLIDRKMTSGPFFNFYYRKEVRARRDDGEHVAKFEEFEDGDAFVELRNMLPEIIAALEKK